MHKLKDLTEKVMNIKENATVLVKDRKRANDFRLT